MNEPLTDERAASHGPASGRLAAPGRPTVDALVAEIGAPDIEAGAAARRAAPAAAGRLAELGRWLAETQGHWPPRAPRNTRLLVFTPTAATVGPAVEVSAAVADLGLRTVVVTDADRRVAHGKADGTADGTADGIADAVADAFAAGVAAADAAVDEGVDLLVVTGDDRTAAAGVLVSAFTGTEPVALLPRGAGATDTTLWIERAATLRDQRRRVVALRHDPDELLVATGSPLLAAVAGCVLRATARRTPIVLDGVTAVSAALLCHEQRPSSARWWQVADGSSDPVHLRAVEDIDRTPVLDLGVTRDDGTSGILAVSVLRMAAAVAAESADGSSTESTAESIAEDPRP